MEITSPELKSSYKWFMPLPTRWMDNDIFGHVNNVNYYSYFDTVANSFLIREGGFDIQNAEVIGYVVHSQCTYLKGIAFPDQLTGGFRVLKLGNSSVTYGIGIFREDADKASAHGTFTHVFVDRKTETSTPIPAPIRTALEQVMAESIE